MTPEVANDALNATLATLQSLIQRCIHLKQSDPEALKLSDEIARRVAKDLRVYGGSATSFSPQLLSCAAVVRQYSKGGAFQTLPDWKSVVDNDPRIKSHPRFLKTVEYRPLVGTPAIMEVQATGSSSIIQPPTVPAVDHGVIKEAPALAADLTPTTPLPACLELEPLTPLAPSVAPAAPETAQFKLFVPGNMSKKAKVTPHPRNNKRKAEADTDSADTPRSPIGVIKPNLKKIKKLPSHDEQDQLHKNIGTPEESLSLGTSDNILDQDARNAVDVASGSNFWDAETRPSDWGLDSTIATAVEHSVRYHPRPCDKCKKLGLPCIVLPDRKIGCTRLACANCDKTKVTCAIDGMGVRDRLLAEAKAKAATRSADHPPKRSRSRVPRARAVNKVVQKPSPAVSTLPAIPSSSHIMEDIVEHNDLDAKARPINFTPAPIVTPLSTMPLSAPIADPEQVRQPEASHPMEQEPTARDILQAIRDLGSKFDLLATNERVDALDAKVDSMEEVFDHRLATLEQRINASDAHWKAMTSSVGHLTNCIRDHKDDPEAHRPQVNTTAYAPPQHSNVQLPAWLPGIGGFEDLGISTVGRQWTHAWDPSVATGAPGDIGTSASAARTGYTPDTPVVRADSIASSRLSSP